MSREEAVVIFACALLFGLAIALIGMPVAFIALSLIYGTPPPWIEFGLSCLVITGVLWGTLWWLGRRVQRREAERAGG